MNASISGRARVLASATRLFGERGFESTSVREIVSAAGVTRSVLYHHFGSKEGLYQEALKQSEQSLEIAVARVATSEGSAIKRLFEVCRVVANAARTRVLGTGRKTFSTQARVIGAIRALIAEGVARGEIVTPDPDGFATGLIAAAEFAATLPGGDGAEQEELSDRVVIAILCGLCRSTHEPALEPSGEEAPCS
ncbi:MAG: TetR/AcrR family transcriptional regulator [Acidobacteria bacterium]|nr:TetR/AcrR family transcriptional regulator [Acidobacteriota bacterium]